MVPCRAVRLHRVGTMPGGLEQFRFGEETTERRSPLFASSPASFYAVYSLHRRAPEWTTAATALVVPPLAQLLCRRGFVPRRRSKLLVKVNSGCLKEG